MEESTWVQDLIDNFTNSSYNKFSASSPLIRTTKDGSYETCIIIIYKHTGTLKVITSFHTRKNRFISCSDMLEVYAVVQKYHDEFMNFTWPPDNKEKGYGIPYQN